MTTYSYIVLTDSNGPVYGSSKRFKATQMRTPLMRTDDIKTALNGALDKSSGPILKTWRYVLRVPFASTDVNYGDKDDLEYFFTLNNPNGDPTDVITLTDHYGVTHQVFFVGNFDPENVTTILDGYNSHYMINIELREVVPNA